MLQHYLTIARRTLAKRKGYTFINIAGLAVGLAGCLLMVLFVQDELSYDRFHTGADQMYRVVFDAQAANAPRDRFAVTSLPIGAELRENYPEVESVVRMTTTEGRMQVGDQTFFDDDALLAEASFFDVFDFPLIVGDPSQALAAPRSVVLSASMADKLYGGTAEAMGQSVQHEDSLFTVTGVMADWPANSHIRADYLISATTLPIFRAEDDNSWLSVRFYTYLRLKPGIDADAFGAKITDMVEVNYSNVLEQIGLQAWLYLQPVPDIYLHSDRTAEIGPTSNIAYVYVFSAVALFLLLIACINFMNLSTARSMERAKEVGVRKALGSRRSALIRQFLSESVLMSVLALVLAAVLLVAVLPAFNGISGKELGLAHLVQPWFVASLIGLTLVVGLLAGAYPALMLSGFEPLLILRGRFRSTRSGARLRQGLVVFQFALSVGLMIATGVVYKQLAFMQNQSLGFTDEQVVLIDAGDNAATLTQQIESVKDEYRRDPAVTALSASVQVPGQDTMPMIVEPEGLAEGETRRTGTVLIDHDYIATYEMDIVAGRDFDEAFETDASQAVLINEAAVLNFGFGTPEEAIGKLINTGADERTVVGVIGDYHHLSLQQSIQPLVMVPSMMGYGMLSLRVRPENLDDTLARLEQTWLQFFPEAPFNYTFLDEAFAEQYTAEQRLMRVFSIFAGLAILIACLGLFGLAAFTAEQRTKEIGVRKVLGASVGSIVLLLSQQFTLLVLIGFAVAAPLAYFAMDRWLDTFPYATSMGLGLFLAAAVLAVLIAFSTVAYQAIRAALIDPVRALRYE
ncbi:MAG: ABC transporter permease [Rhodothermales bacterium]